MAKAKAALKTRSPKDTVKDVPQKPIATDELNPHNEWNFKITGRGTSGWMSWVQEGGVWVQLRPSNTSFISAVAAIEPEVMRLAFPHRTTHRKAI